MKNITLAFLSILAISTFVYPQTKQSLRVDFKQTTLKNGLRVVIAEDNSAPIVTVAVTYNVGSANERKGRTGFNHLFEHMMFQGSENVAKNEHAYLVFTNGGKMEGAAFLEYTFYGQTVPSNQLELLLFLEADRMRSLAVTKENLDNQRKVVKAEKQGVLSRNPRSPIVLRELLFDNYAYQHDENLEDLEAATLEDVKDFFETYYVPDNAALTIIGNFKAKEVLDQVKKYFESIPRGKTNVPKLDLKESDHKAERRAVNETPNIRLPRLDIGYLAPQGNTPDFYALRVLSTLLQRGESSRLFQKLVKEKELASSVSSSVSERRGTAQFNLTAMLRPNIKAEDIEAVLDKELERVKKEPVTDLELQKAKNFIERDFISFNLQDPLRRADSINWYALSYNDPNLINTFMDKIMVITKEDILRAANKYFTKENRAVVITIPKRENAN